MNTELLALIGLLIPIIGAGLTLLVWVIRLRVDVDQLIKKMETVFNLINDLMKRDK